MPEICLSDLTEGDELGISETPECCDAITDEIPGGYRCGRCDSFANVDADGGVTYIQLN